MKPCLVKALPHFYFFLHYHHQISTISTTTIFPFIPPNRSIKDGKLPQLAQFVAVSQVAKKNRGFPQLCAVSGASNENSS